jgi:pimeloyl-ACP methyl ester carboxylesterase
MKATAISIAIVFAVYIGLSIYGAIAAMEIPRLPLNDSPASVGLAYEDVSFTSRDDNVVLRGWYIPGERDFIIIIVHGGYQNRVDYNADTLRLAHDLVEKGYDLLLFDLRGRGESEGKGLSLSNIEHDIGGAVDYLKSKGYPAKTIGIIGFCSGAASSCIFASQESIGALVLDGCFYTVNSMVAGGAASRGIPRFLVDFFLPGVLLMSKIIYGYELVNPIDVVAGITCPILFIHEEHDNLVSLEETFRLFKASDNPANELWEVSAAEHSQAYKTYPSDYVERIDNFLATKVK